MIADAGTMSSNVRFRESLAAAFALGIVIGYRRYRSYLMMLRRR
jgi:hypothetical protein